MRQDTELALAARHDDLVDVAFEGSPFRSHDLEVEGHLYSPPASAAALRRLLTVRRRSALKRWLSAPRAAAVRGAAAKDPARRRTPAPQRGDSDAKLSVAERRSSAAKAPR